MRFEYLRNRVATERNHPTGNKTSLVSQVCQYMTKTIMITRMNFTLDSFSSDAKTSTAGSYRIARLSERSTTVFRNS